MTKSMVLKSVSLSAMFISMVFFYFACNHSDSKTKVSPRSEFYYWASAELYAVRSGKWKLHVKKRGPIIFWKREEMERPELYEIESDISEKYNRFAELPNIVAEFQKKMEVH